MENPKNVELNVTKQLLHSKYIKIFEILKNIDFYTHPKVEEIEQIKSFIRKMQEYLRSRGEQSKFQVPALLLESTIQLIDEIQKQDFNGIAITSLRSTWPLANPLTQRLLEKPPRVFCQFYLLAQFRKMPNLIENGDPEVRQIPELMDSVKGQLVKAEDDPIAFIQTAFTVKYNEIVKWSSSEKFIYTLKIFTKEQEANFCIQKLKERGIEECFLRTLPNGFRVEIPILRIFQAMDKDKKKEVDQPRQNVVPRPGGRP